MEQIQSVKRKVENLIEKYDKFLKSPSHRLSENFSNVFDITNEKGIWLCNEDKKLYDIQVLSKGEVGFCTNKKVDIHPSKKRKLNEQSTSSVVKEQEESGSNSETSQSDTSA